MSEFETDLFAEDDDFQWRENMPYDSQGPEDLVEDELDLFEGECESDSSPSPLVIQRIEEMVLSLMMQLLKQGRERTDHSTASEPDDGGKKSSPATKPGIELRLVDRTKASVGGVVKMKTLKYPRRSRTGSLRSFAQLFRVLDLVHEATLSGVPMTKRDIYYKDVPLFKSQRIVDTLVDDVAATFELDRSDLNIRSSSKGLICGSGMTINLVSGDVVHCNDTEATLIPAGEDIQTFSVKESVEWVLIVEKEAVFQTLCQLGITKLLGHGLIITGKGYPDVATRHLVKSLADALPRTLPILVLVDGDPYGIDILSVYKNGSKSMSHEKEKLAARRVKWVGLWGSELTSLGISKERLLPITKHDEKKALSLLGAQNPALPMKWKKELQHMLHNRRKAEIEILCSPPQPEDTGPHGLFLQYVTTKIEHFVQAARGST